MPYEDRDHCESYGKKLKLCQDDPECVFCRQGVDGVEESKAGLCVHRSRTQTCAERDYHDATDRCPGICAASHTCGACVSHGGTHSDSGKNSSDLDINPHTVK
ncbi:hypothetical protein EGW08_011806, partial [Elysia chlorotica]